jgi:hypothetical protein
MRQISHFFSKLFEAYPPSDPAWHIYEQYAFKVAIRYTNKGHQPRPMWEIRSGQDGMPEIDEKGQPPFLAPGETRWIVIEPSNKTFYLDESVRFWGSAAYPKSIDDMKTTMKPVTKRELPLLQRRLKQNKLVLPFEQIAATIRSLYPNIQCDASTLQDNLYQRKLLDLGVGVPGMVRLVRSRAMVIGRIVKSDRFSGVFPMSYRDVPIERGCLLLVDLTERGALKKGPIKYKTSEGKVEIKGAMARIIDAPQVKGALWKRSMSSSRERLKKRIPDLVHKARKILVESARYRFV